MRSLWSQLRGRFTGPRESGTPPVRGEASALTREHVEWAYRLFLDREPENGRAVEAKLSAWRGTQDLRRDFMISPEFREKNPSSAGYLNRSTPVITEIEGGLRLFVDLADSVIGLNIAQGQYEPVETAFVRSFVKPGQYVVDVGANVGYYSIVLASLVGPEGHVSAYEPLEENARLLERSLLENGFEGRVTLRQAAAGAESGTAEIVYLPLEVGALNSGGAYLKAAGTGLPPHHRMRRVPVRTLDDDVKRRPVRFIKVDVEGAEPFVFRGARALLREDRPTILSEINPPQLRSVAACSPEDLIRELAALGYRCHALKPDGVGGEITGTGTEAVRSVVFCPHD